jgi:hypothetical protein
VIFAGGMPFCVDEWCYERDLQSDLLAPECGRWWQSCNLIQRMLEPLDGLNQRRAFQRPLSRLAPIQSVSLR